MPERMSTKAVSAANPGGAHRAVARHVCDWNVANGMVTRLPWVLSMQTMPIRRLAASITDSVCGPACMAAGLSLQLQCWG